MMSNIKEIVFSRRMALAGRRSSGDDGDSDGPCLGRHRQSTICEDSRMT